jgi:hypothetical protein
LPAGVFADVELAAQRKVSLPTRDSPDGAENWNGDARELSGKGVAGFVVGPVSATRWTVQRGHHEWFTSDQHQVQAKLSFERLVLSARFDAELSVLDVQPPNLLIETLSFTPDSDNPDNHVELLFFQSR